MLKLTEGYHPAYMQGWNENIDAANREIAELESELTEAQQEGVKWLRIAQEFERGEERTLAEIARLENILAGGAHSCSNTCMRPVCRLRREIRESAEMRLEQAKTIAGLEERQRWIPVSERLPDEGVIVVVPLIFSEIQAAKYVDGMWCAAFGKKPILSAAGTPMKFKKWYPLPPTEERENNE